MKNEFIVKDEDIQFAKKQIEEFEKTNKGKCNVMLDTERWRGLE